MASDSPGSRHEARRNLKLHFPMGMGLNQAAPTPVVNRQPEPNSHSHGLHMEQLRTHKAVGKLSFDADKVYEYSAEDLVDLGEIGRGNYGTVNKMLHTESGTQMAVKRIRSTVDQKEQKQLLMDMDVVMRSSKCPYIVKFYGALFTEPILVPYWIKKGAKWKTVTSEFMALTRYHNDTSTRYFSYGDAWICMELMETSFDKVYKVVYGSLQQTIPEDIIGKVSFAVVHALDHLKTNLNIIHRDVKPSNILLDLKGNIKLCDFGISGQLVNSIAKTRDVGCKPYMAPERIDPTSSRQGYDIRSDVWSFGITIVELATGKFPYPKWHNVFDQLSQVVKGDPPRLKNEEHDFTPEMFDFVNSCLTKDVAERPKYTQLLKHSFIARYETKEVDVGLWIADILAQAPEDFQKLQISSSGSTFSS